MHQQGYIVIVETDDLILQLLERWLGEAGYAVVVGVPGTPALEQPVRLVIVNVSKPRSARTLIRALEAAYAAPPLTLMYLTAHSCVPLACGRSNSPVSADTDTPAR